MSDQPVSPAEVRRQVWESLVSMLRVYTHAASLNSDGYGVASNAETVWVTRAESVLQVSFSPATGAATWRLERPGRNASGTFQIDEAGRLIFPESERELDEAAIHWLQQLGQPGCAV